MKRVIVFDTETTGLLLHPSAPLSAQPRIIEFAAVILNDGIIEGKGSLIINPGVEISDEITKITGLTNADLKAAPFFTAVLPKIRGVFKNIDMVMAHNLSFDKGMLMNDLERFEARKDFPWPLRELCTVELYHELFGYRPSLKKLYARIMGEPLKQTHRALDDVLALVEIIQKERLWNL